MTNKKRTADGGSPTPALKRRKASAMSISSSVVGSAHPLRQTSFPPDDANTSFYSARSPSADMDMDNMSLVSGSQVSAAPKKKRGRKSKADKAREQTPSVVGGRATASLVSGPAGGKITAGVGGGKNNEEEGGEDENEGPTEVAATAAALTKEQKEEEHRLRGMLIAAFSEDQFDRFENWRAANLSKAAVRRLVNATISQSVAENVVIGMRAVAKVFIGDIIESARRVQGEWIEKTDEKQTDLPTPPATAAPSPSADTSSTQTQTPALTETTHIETQTETQIETQTETQTATQADTQTALQPQPQTNGPGPEDRRGPLRPEHLREAMRRHRLSLEGGGVGMQLLWHHQQQSGVERFPTRTGGRRIFR